MGTAGGIYHFRDEILRGNPQQFFVMHVDVACTFPLNEMLTSHMRHRGLCTMLSTKVKWGEEDNASIFYLLSKIRVTTYMYFIGGSRSSQQVRLLGAKS